MTDPAQVLLPGFDGPDLPPWLERRLRDGLAGVCLFASNIVDPVQLRRLTDAIRDANPAALIAIDEEGGDVTRIHTATGSPYPGNAWLGRRDDLAETRRQSELIAGELRAAGCNLNLAPCADINSDPRNPVIGTRSFGTDPALVARHTAAWIEGHQAHGVAACAKHFPGHGATAVDSHVGLPTVDLDASELSRRELVPFVAAIDATVWSIMTSHIKLPRLDPSAPATLSSAILVDLLRDQLGFAGAVISDALDMTGASGERGIPAAAVAALAGGCDLLCIGNGNTAEQLDEIEAAIELAIARREFTRARLDDAVRRVRALSAHTAEPSARSAGQSASNPTGLTSAEVAAQFEISPRAKELIAQASGASIPWSVVALETPRSVAAGPDPRGVASGRVSATSAVSDVEVPSGPLAIIGSAIHRHAWATEFVDGARSRNPETIVVDLGWPDESRRYADIVTFGSARIIEDALLGLLALSPAGGA